MSDLAEIIPMFVSLHRESQNIVLVFEKLETIQKPIGRELLSPPFPTHIELNI